MIFMKFYSHYFLVRRLLNEIKGLIEGDIYYNHVKDINFYTTFTLFFNDILKECPLSSLEHSACKIS